MHHVFVETSAASIGSVWTDREINICEHTPGADHFYALRVISLDQKVVPHFESPWNVERSLDARYLNVLVALGCEAKSLQGSYAIATRRMGFHIHMEGLDTYDNRREVSSQSC